MDSFNITPCLWAADLEFDSLNWVYVPAMNTTCRTFCDEMEEFLSDENDKIVINGVEITNDAHHRLMKTLKDDEDFDIEEN